MVCEQVRKLLLASLLVPAIGCWGGEAVDPARIWDDTAVVTKPLPNASSFSAPTAPPSGRVPATMVGYQPPTASGANPRGAPPANPPYVGAPTAAGPTPWPDAPLLAPGAGPQPQPASTHPPYAATGSPYVTTPTGGPNSPYVTTPTGGPNSPYVTPPTGGPNSPYVTTPTGPPNGAPYVTAPNNSPYVTPPNGAPYVTAPNNSPYVTPPNGSPYVSGPEGSPYVTPPSSPPASGLPFITRPAAAPSTSFATQPNPGASPVRGAPGASSNGFPATNPPLGGSQPPFGPAAQGPNAPGQNLGQASRLEQFEPARIVARVGDQFILAGDVLGSVNQVLAPHRDKMTDEQYEQQKERLVQMMVKQMVEAKIMFVAFLRQIPPERVQEAVANVREQAFSQYDEQELEKAMEKAKVKSAGELDAYLRRFGTSLYKQKLQYMEMQLGRMGVRQNIEVNPEITHQEMIDYYREHAEDYELAARARWEKLTASFRETPDRERARWQIGVMGDEVLLGGAPLSAVAKRSSQGLDKDDGGYHDWTTRGSLRSKPLDTAIFSLPLNQLSQVIEDENGYHIVRVVEREDAGRTSFVEAQVEIKQKLLNEKRQAQVREHLNSLRESVNVWTIFDEEEEVESEPAAAAN